jgi:hypothetical protein
MVFDAYSGDPITGFDRHHHSMSLEEAERFFVWQEELAAEKKGAAHSEASLGLA